MKRWLAVVVLAATAVLGFPVAATGAASAQADCAGNRYTSGTYEYFEPERRLVPPPLRSTSWDCAIRTGDAVFDETVDAEGRYLQSVQYVLLYVDLDFDGFVALLRALEDAGYSERGDVNIVDNGTDVTTPVDGLDADDLAALDPRPTFVGARFSNAQNVPAPSTPGANIYELTWTDGVASPSPSGIDGRPQLFANIILTEPFLDGTQFDDPSDLSGLPTIAQAAPTGVQWAVIASGSLMLMLVVGWPSTLLNSVVGSRYQQLQRWVGERFRRKDAPSPEPLPDGRPRQSRLPGWLMWPGFALAAILGAFVDPDFGWNPMSARLVLTLFLSFLLFNLAAWWVVRRVAVRLQPDSAPYLRFRWGSLALVILAVLVARLLGLEPGVIFGLVAGIAYATTLQAAKSAIVTIVGSAFGLALAIVAWVGYSLLAPLPVDGAAYVFLVEFLAGVTVKGVSTLPLSLLPLGNLEGAKLFGWRKGVWAASYVVGLGAFMVVLATVPKSWGEVPDFLRWVWIFGAYALVALVVWIVNARMLAKRPLPPEKQQGDQPDAITID